MKKKIVGIGILILLVLIVVLINFYFFPKKGESSMFRQSASENMPHVFINETPDSNITFSFIDYVIDTNDNGLYEYLIIEFETNLSEEEEYNVSASLVDNSGRSTSIKNKKLELGENKSVVQLNFSGLDIYSNEMEGTFRLGGFRIKNNDMEIYSSKYIYNTSQYDHNEFENQIHLFNCSSLNRKNLVYVLQNDIEVRGDCFEIKSHNIILDLNGYNILGNGSGRGVYWRIYDNNVIQNGTISNFAKGIEIKNSKNHIIKNSFISSNKGDGMNNGMGIYLFRSNNNEILQNNFSSNKGFAIELDGSDNNLLKDNNIQQGLKGGINIFSSHNNSIEKNVIIDNKYIAIYLNFASGNIVENNRIEKNELWGIYISGGNDQEDKNNLIANNFIFQNRRSGIRLTGANILYNQIISNTIDNNFVSGIELYAKNNNEVSDNLIKDNTISDNWVAGIHIIGTKDNVISGNKIERHDCGFFIEEGKFEDNEIGDNYFEDNEEDISYDC